MCGQQMNYFILNLIVVLLISLVTTIPFVAVVLHSAYLAIRNLAKGTTALRRNAVLVAIFVSVGFIWQHLDRNSIVFDLIFFSVLIPPARLAAIVCRKETISLRYSLMLAAACLPALCITLSIVATGGSVFSALLSMYAP